MPVKKGTCDFPVDRTLESAVCGLPGEWRERSDHGMAYGYYLCDDHWNFIQEEKENV